MSPERWQRLQDLYERAISLTVDERPRFLATACSDDPALQREVESLLAADSQWEPRVTAAIDAVFSTAFARTAVNGRAHIGPYRVVRELGRGGMSTVYLAERDDNQYLMQVAVKVIKRGMETEEVVQRLRQERQILASLSHPNIARLLDGGSTDDGLPYFVMEHIDGEPIDLYCQRRGLSLLSRVELFREVCAAVLYAHQNLVIHRDIKPSNLLVTQLGVPKLLDFGIAKLLDPGLLPGSQARTAPGVIALTPEFASPEQMRGEPLSTATDIYSLGVVLYLLLTDRHPHALEGRTLQDLERLIRTTSPPRPSTVAVAERAPLLRGDLDTILLKALHQDPQQRYASVEQLSEDLRRYRDGLPVLARPDALGYRMGKFVRRHRAGVIAAGLVAMSLLGGILATVRQARIAERARERAEEVRDFLISIFHLADPVVTRGETVTAREILRQGAARITRELGGQPADRAMLMDAIGRSYHQLGLYADARPLLEQALQLRQEARGPSLEVAESLHSLGELLFVQGDLAQAEKSLRDALALRQKLLGERHAAVAETLNSLGVIAYARGDPRRADPLLRQALTLRKAVLGPAHPAVAESLSNLAAVLAAEGQQGSALELYREALALQRRVLGEEHPDVATTCTSLAKVLYEQKDYAGAEELARQALAIRRTVFGAAHPAVATALRQLAAVLYARGDYAQAEPLGREALALQRQLLGNDHLELSLTLNNLADVLTAQGDPASAEPLYREALAIRTLRLEPKDLRVAASQRQLGACLLALGRYAEAEPLLLASYPLLQNGLGDDHPVTRQARQELFELYRRWGRAAAAAHYLDGS